MNNNYNAECEAKAKIEFPIGSKVKHLTIGFQGTVIHQYMVGPEMHLKVDDGNGNVNDFGVGNAKKIDCPSVESAKYGEYRTERLEIFETLITAGANPETLETMSEAFSLMSEGDAEKMMGFWREATDLIQ